MANLLRGEDPRTFVPPYLGTCLWYTSLLVLSRETSLSRLEGNCFFVPSGRRWRWRPAPDKAGFAPARLRLRLCLCHEAAVSTFQRHQTCGKAQGLGLGLTARGTETSIACPAWGFLSEVSSERHLLGLE
jgi:hypothetical protein